jgi:hypothetical protein
MARTGRVVQLEQALADERRRARATLRQHLVPQLQGAEEERYRLGVASAQTLDKITASATAIAHRLNLAERRRFDNVAELLRLRYRMLVSQREEAEEIEKLQADKLFFAAKEEAAKQLVRTFLATLNASYLLHS